MCRHCNKHLKTTHHIYSQSRFPEIKSVAENKVIVDQLSHQQYHELFQTKTPEEAAVYLARYFWGGNTDIIESVMRELQKLL